MSRIEFYCQKAIIGVIVVLLVACGGDKQNTADTVFPIHAIAGASQLADVNIPAATFGPRANYTITKTTTGYKVTDVVGATGTQTFSLAITQIVFSDMTVNLGIGDKSQNISAANLQSLIELYIAYFNRVPDADGLSYWIDQLVAGQSIDQIGASFYNAAIQYSSLTGYSSSMSNSDFITQIYKNVLGRTSVDSNGLSYWLLGLANGSQTRGTLVRTILGSAHTFKGDPTYGYVADLLDNKVLFANSFTIQQGLNYNTPQESITNTMAMVAAITPKSNSGAIALLGRVDWDFAEVQNPTFATSPQPFYSVPTDLSKIVYPTSYTSVTANSADIGVDPCQLNYSVIAYPQSWNGAYPLPAIKGAPMPQNFSGGMSLKDIMLPDNPTFNINKNCAGNLNSEFDRTIARLIKLNVKYVKIPQWHWISVNSDGSWSVVKAENSFGPLPDANLAYFVNAAHKAGLKVILMNQIQGINDASTGNSYVPDSIINNYDKWFLAYSTFVKERAPYFQSLGIDVWELGCGYCIFSNTGTGSKSDLDYFSNKTEGLIPVMQAAFKGSLLMMTNGWLQNNPSVLKAIDFINFGIYDVGWGRINSANSSQYNVAFATSQILMDQLNPDSMKSFDKLGKTLVFDATLQSRANVFTLPGYLEETGCTSSIGNLNIDNSICLQKQTLPDFSVQAIFFEAVFESLVKLNLSSKIIPIPMDYWETDSMVSTSVFPNLGSTIRNKPAEGIVKKWYTEY